jgi:hypothetical protein
MYKRILFFSLILLLGCTDTDDKHEFRFEITGTATQVDNMRVKMGPGVDFNSEGKVELPVSIIHEIYGNNLIYLFEIEHFDKNSDVTLKVFVDDELVEENNTFVETENFAVITIKGVYK